MDEEAFMENVRAEVEDNMRRLRHRAADGIVHPRVERLGHQLVLARMIGDGLRALFTRP